MFVNSSSKLFALSPVDGRYADTTDGLRPIFSEYGLIYHRVLIEIRWFEKLAATPAVSELPRLSKATQGFLTGIVDQFNESDAKRIKAIERSTNHDLKAVEYFLREHFTRHPVLKKHTNFLHFACTSWDINNLAYGVMLNTARQEVIKPALKELSRVLARLKRKYARAPILSRTHGQPASPTTMGKEIANFHYRLQTQTERYSAIKLTGKANGAVGNFNAHMVAYPKADWHKISRTFVTSLGLEYNPYTTQIDPYDSLAEMLHGIVRINNILLDLCRDMWGYISLGYFVQKTDDTHVGSSTMPHKVNPIDFENAEGNAGVANALAEHLATKLCVSRWQRDLSDSTALRSLGVVFAHTLLAVKAAVRGLEKLDLDTRACTRDLDAHYEVLAEALQTVMRKHGIADAYEQIKRKTRGQPINGEMMKDIIADSDLPADAKDRLLNMKPADYTGMAEILAKGQKK